MVFGAAIPIIGALSGFAARVGITSASLRSASGTFAQSLPFGAGYSFGTYIGFPGNYKPKTTYSRQRSYNMSMPYTRYGRYYSRYQRRYPRRYGRRYSSYGSRRYGRRYY